MTRECEHCGNSFEPHAFKPDQRFCGGQCRKVAWSRRQRPAPWRERNCARCAKPFERTSEFDHQRQYCSPACRNDAARDKVPQRWRHLASRYRLAPETFLAMLESQNGKCRICQTPVTGEARDRDAPQVDHDHETGEIRAILRRLCNTALGNFRDDPELVASALDYLREWKHAKVT